jgi:hypothetical protein
VAVSMQMSWGTFRHSSGVTDSDRFCSRLVPSAPRQ